MHPTDIRLSAPDGRFTLRAAALIIRNRCLLAVKDTAHDSYYTVGGKIRMGESSREAALREAYEETGCRFEIDRLLFVQERFFTFQETPHHEICFYYLMKETDFNLPPATHTDQSFETLHDLPLEQLPFMNIVPAFLKTALQQPPQTAMHFITQE